MCASAAMVSLPPTGPKVCDLLISCQSTQTQMRSCRQNLLENVSVGVVRNVGAGIAHWWHEMNSFAPSSYVRAVSSSLFSGGRHLIRTQGSQSCCNVLCV